MTFGYELEFLGASLFEMSRQYNISYIPQKKRCNYQEFTLKPENLVTNDRNIGGELISPIYMDKEICLEELKEKLIQLKSLNAYIPKDSSFVGFHVHVGKDILNQDLKRYHLLFKFLFAFQSEIFLFAKGKWEHLRPQIYEYAFPFLEEEIHNYLMESSKLSSYQNLLSGKNKCLRLTKQTIEYRYFSSSLEFEVLESFLNFVLSLSEKISYGLLDEEIVNFYYEKCSEMGFSVKKERVLTLEKLIFH